MKTIHRRKFIKESAATAGSVMVAPAYLKNMITNSPNKRVNIGLAGISGTRLVPSIFKYGSRGMISGRGIAHINGYSKVPNAIITKVCDVDERLFPGVMANIERLYGDKPATEVDFRKMCDDKDIDIISIATPDHWHALHTIWACQAGKDVYVEKPVSWCIWEGRKMVEAARKYNRIVQAGICYRSSRAVREGVKFITDGKLGKVYMAKGLVKCRSHKDLDNDILKGHLSAALGHLGVISYRTGRKLTFNPATEKFVDDKEADSYLKRPVYRKPYVAPDVV